MTLEAPIRQVFIENAPQMTPAQVVVELLTLATLLGLLGFGFAYIVWTGRAW